MKKFLLHLFLRRENYIIGMLLLFSNILFAQSTSISGRVVDSSNEPMIGTSVLLEGTTVGAITSTDGSFKISITPDQKKSGTLVFQFIGYTTKNVPIENRSVVNAKLDVEAFGLDEVVAIGYGKQSRSTLTTAISKVDTKELEQVTYTNATSALQGRVAGLRVSNESGQPGSTPRVILRGGTSIDSYSNSQPLYIVDGVQRSNMQDINTEDIETIQVLKDAASTAIYGSKASNGVILITTKRGVKGKGTIKYSGSLSLNSLGRTRDMLNAEEYIYYGRLGVVASAEQPGNEYRISRLDEAHGYGTGNDLTDGTNSTTQFLTEENSYKLNEGWSQMTDPVSGNEIIFKDTNFQDLLFRTGVRQNHHIGFSRGTETGSFNLSLGYLDEEGIAVGTSFTRYSAMMNAEQMIFDNFKVNGKIELSHSLTQSGYTSVQTMFERVQGLPQTAKDVYEDGSIAVGKQLNLGNPLYYNDKILNDTRKTRITALVGFDWELMEGLNFRPQMSLYSLNNYENDFDKAYASGSGSNIYSSREARGEVETEWNKQFDAILSYTNSFDNHNIVATAVATYTSESYYQLEAEGRYAATDNIYTLNASAEATDVSSQFVKNVVAGYVGRVNYNYNRRFLAGVSVRYDGASNVGAENLWGVFPGISAGWNLHNEQFIKEIDVINNLKVRASFGTTANNNISTDKSDNAYTPQGEYDASSKYDGSSAVKNTMLANQDLQWEVTKTFDAGFDVGLFNGKLNVIFDYYNKLTDNLITDLELPLSTGFSSIRTNLGQIRNQGLELDINANIIENSNFSWDFNLNGNWNSHKIEKMPENGTINNRIGGVYVYDSEDPSLYSWKGGFQEGERMDEMYAYVQTGIYKTDEEADAKGYTDEPSGFDPRGGDVIWEDRDSNKIINSNDKAYMGHAIPDITGGVTNTFNYKNLSLRVFMDYAIGHTIYDYSESVYLGQFQGDINSTAKTKESWVKSGDDAKYARYNWADQLSSENYWRGNSINFYKGDYICLREISLTYNFGSELLEKLPINSANIYFTGSNLFYSTDKGYEGGRPEGGAVSGSDPGYQGADRGSYPTPRVCQFGLNLNF